MGNRIHRSQASISGDAVKVTGYADDAVVSGSAFLFEKNITIAALGTALVLFDYTTYVPTEPWQQGIVYITRPVFQTTAGPSKVTLYRGTNYTGGTVFKAYNPNLTAEKTEAQTRLSIGPTGTVKGVVSMEYLVGGNSQGANAQAGTADGLSFFITRNNRKALVEIVNGANEEITFHYGQGLFEI